MNAAQVRRGYYTIAGLYNLSASLIWGVNTLFLLGAGLSLFETFVANAFFTAGQVIFEIPTGVIADTLGRRTSFLWSLITLLIGTLAYIWLAETGAGLALFAVASVILGLGFTFYSGAVEAWVVDALDSVGAVGRKDMVFARGGQFQGAAMLIGTIGGGLLGQVDLTWPYWVRSILLAILFVVALRYMKDIGFEKRSFLWSQLPKEMKAITKTSLDHGWRRPVVRLMMIMSMLYWGYLIWAWYAWQPYFLDLLGMPLIWVAGLIAALVSITMIIGNQVAASWGGRYRPSTVLAIMGALFSGAILITGLAPSVADLIGLPDAAFVIAVSSFLLAMAAFGIIIPTQQAALHACLPSKARATIVSFASLLGSAVAVFSQVGLGWFTQTAGIGAGYVIGAAWTIFAVPLALSLRRFPEADGKNDGGSTRADV